MYQLVNGSNGVWLVVVVVVVLLALAALAPALWPAGYLKTRNRK